MNEQAKILVDDILAPAADTGKVPKELRTTQLHIAVLPDCFQLNSFAVPTDHQRGPVHHQLRPRHHLQLGHGKARGRAARHGLGVREGRPQDRRTYQRPDSE